MKRIVGVTYANGLCTGITVDGIDDKPVYFERIVHGRWITWAEAGNDVPSEYLYECSACHDAAPHLVNGFDFLSAYCPNCGAKMDE